MMSKKNQATGKKHILIVEDERSIAQALSLKFTREGYYVTVAYDGVSALEKLHEMHFDGVVLDLLMPQKNGFDVLRERTKTKNSKTPIFVLSAVGAEEEINAAKSLGAAKYFLKSQTTLKEVVQEVAGAI